MCEARAPALSRGCGGSSGAETERQSRTGFSGTQLINLLSRASAVNDDLVMRLLREPRFAEVAVLSLEGTPFMISIVRISARLATLVLSSSVCPFTHIRVHSCYR